VALEVEDRRFPEDGGVEIAVRDDEFVLLASRFDHDSPSGLGAGVAAAIVTVVTGMLF